MGCLPLFATQHPHHGLLGAGHLAPLEVLPVVHPREVQRAVNHQLLDAHLSASRADHHLPHHLSVRPVDLEAEHVGRLVLTSESQVEVADDVRLDEGHRDFAQALDIEAAVGEGRGGEPGGQLGIERAVAGFVENCDGEGHGPPRCQVASPAALWAAALSAGASGYSIRGPRNPMRASRIASPASWMSRMASSHSSNCPSLTWRLMSFAERAGERVAWGFTWSIWFSINYMGCSILPISW